MKPTPFWQWFVVVFIFTCLGSCDKNAVPTLHPLSGSVTFQDEPVELGSITFDPSENVGILAPSWYGAVNAGKYASPPEALAPGEYLVAIQGRNTKVPLQPSGDPVPLFKIYRTKVQIPAPGNEFNIVIPNERRP